MAEYIGAPAGCPEVSCLFRFTLGANYRAHGIQLRDGGLILCWRKIRTDREQTDRQTDREFKYRGHSYPLWIVGGSWPIKVTGNVGKYLVTDKKVK